MIQMIYNDTSDRSGCQRKRAASEILMMTSSVMPWRRKYFFRKDDDMNIKYISVENSIAEWADKKGILKRWDGLNQYTLNRWIKEMRENRTFSMYVINPTHKLVFINLEGFESFLRWKQKRTK